MSYTQVPIPVQTLEMEEIKNDPIEICSEILSMNIIDSNKKRKFEGEPQVFPSPKHKFRDRIFDSDHISWSSKDCMQENSLTFAREVIKPDQQLESSRDSNSVIEEFDTTVSVNIGGKKELGYIKTHFHDHPSISSGSCSTDSFGSSLYSLESRNSKGKTNDREESSFVYKLSKMEQSMEKEVATFLNPEESGSPDLDIQFPGLSSNYPDYICSEYGNNINEPNLDEITEEMIYSNDVTSNLFVLSSGRWSINPDSRHGARKPTIDQEFEQYFSMLML